VKELEEKILKEGHALSENILKVDSFINHQVDPVLMQQIGDAFAGHFGNKGITKVVTIESSGIAPALMTALSLNVPMIILKKQPSKVLNDNLLQTVVTSFTKGTSYELTLSPNDINARAAMAEIYLARKEYDSALVLEMEIINLDKKNKEAYQGLITIYEAKGQYDKITELASTVTDTDLLELFSGYIVAEPVFYPDEGTYDVYTEVTIFSIEECDIYYTLDESDPKKNGILYTDAGIELDDVGKYTIKAVCKNDNGIYSDVVTCKYKTEAKAPDYPEVTPDGGTMDDITFVVITADEGCSIYYTWDGTDPTDLSARYTEPIEVPEGNNILSIIVVNDKTKLTSEIYRTNFIYHAKPGVEVEE
jgi:xanthine phosphoribosyltransferase